MIEYPIPFMDDMIRAILAGKKTQTRRTSDRYGKLKPGDILWARENHYREPGVKPPFTQVFYRADGKLPTLDTLHSWGLYKNYSPMFMPRWASRITLEIVSVRAERLQEITNADAMEEGIAHMYGYTRTEPAQDGRARFAELWESINGDKPGRTWADDPLVWRIEFKAVK